VSYSCHQSHIYQLGRYNSNYITKFSVDNPQKAIYQYSLKGKDLGDNPNPMQIIHLNDKKAYILFLNADVIWVVNPSAEKEEDFYLKSISLKDYVNDKMLPNKDQPGQVGANQGVLHKGKLYVSLGRFNRVGNKDGCYALNESESYVAVIDTNTDEEIDTGVGKDGMKGIPLQTRNPQRIRLAGDNLIVASSAELCANYNSGLGGIESINLNNHEESRVLIPVNSYLDFAFSFEGQVYALKNLDISKGSTELQIVDMDNNNLDKSRIQQDGVSFSEIRSLETAPNGEIWALDANKTFPGIHRIDASSDSKIGIPFETKLRPLNLQFCQKKSLEDEIAIP
jgi:hypothetical protein